MTKPFDSSDKYTALYVHWPWCLKKCPYCDFNSHTGGGEAEEEYVAALLKDMAYQAQNIEKKPLISIFFGGGTPSLMAPKSVQKVIEKAAELFDFNNEIEITLEANPTSSSQENFKNFAAAGVNRFSVGVQSFDEEALKFLGREHNSGLAIKTVEAALNVTENVNLDIIYGWAGQSVENLKSQLRRAAGFGTSHISAYQLTVEPNTLFHKMAKNGEHLTVNTHIEADMFSIVRETIVSHGFDNYEISNFSKPYMPCLHNEHIWKYGHYIGVGAGAHGRVKNLEGKLLRTSNFKIPSAYISSILKDGHALHTKTPLNRQEMAEERLMMGLRLKNGTTLQDEDLNHYNMKQLELLQNMGFIKLSADKNLRLTEKGWPLLNSILAEIMA